MPVILFLTSPEHGQANCQLATIAALKERHPEVDIHLATNESFRRRAPDNVTFHAIDGKGLSDYYDLETSDPVKIQSILDYVTTKPGFWGKIAASQKFLSFVIPETPDEYVTKAKAVEALLEKLQPDFTLVDSLFNPAIDALQVSGMRYAKLSPNTVKEVALGEQKAKIFTIPSTGIGYIYPLSIITKVLNAIALIYTIRWITKSDPKQLSLTKPRHDAGYLGPLPMFAPRTVPALCMSHPQLDFPLIIPDGVVCCGPILSATKSLADVDPELNTWVHRRPTILIVLGSHWRMTEDYAHNVLNAVRNVLDKQPNLQILWKLQKFGEYELKVDDERIRISSWLKADPYAILATGQVVCSVNHGGSNSYHEALATGTPQVILSPWYDCHDFGGRVEWLGIGKWGNKNAAPMVDEHEFSAALSAVLSESPEGEKLRSNAKAAGVTITTPRAKIQGFEGDASGLTCGREVAAEWIWQYATKGDE